MKQISITISLMLIGFLSMAQDTAKADKVVASIKEYYNKSDYKSLYNLMSEDAKKQMSEEEVIQFFGKKLKTLGDINSYEFDIINNGNFIYNVKFDVLNLVLTMQLDAENKVAGWLWKPAELKAKKTGANTKPIKTNNPLQTPTQIYLDYLAKEYLMDDRNCGLSIGFINNDKVEMYYYGETKKGSGQLPSENSLYEIGSISKTFTGILLANALNNGKIKLDDDIRKYLPKGYKNLHYKGIPIRIKDLSNHTSRLPRLPMDLDKQPGYDVNNPYKNYTKEMMYNYLKTVQLDTFPGTVYDYSNYGVALLGKILENVNKKSLEELLKEIITSKYKMPQTKFNLSSDEKQNECTGYTGEGTETSYWDLGDFAAAGGIKSNLPDMLNYLKANLEETNADIKLSHQQTSYVTLQPVALNWILSKTKDNKTLIWHNGGTSGFRTFCGFVNEKKVGLVVLSNSGNGVDDIANNMINYLLMIHEHQTKISVNIKDTLTLDPTVCKKYKDGKYYTERMFMGTTEIPVPDQSDYTEVKGNTVTDYFNGGKHVNKWTITYASDCEWKQTLEETNDPSMSAVIKKGDSIVLKAVGSTPSGGLYLESVLAGLKFIVLIVKK